MNVTCVYRIYHDLCTIFFLWISPSFYCFRQCFRIILRHFPLRTQVKPMNYKADSIRIDWKTKEETKPNKLYNILCEL